MSNITTAQVTIEQTEHPYIVRTPGVSGGSPIIKGTRVTVRLIAQLYKAGESVEEIIRAYPHLSAAAVYDAISYYLDHQIEIEDEIEASRLENVVKEYGLHLDKRGFGYFDSKK